MSIFLAGAGPDPLGFPEVFDRFAREVAGRAGTERPARVAVVVHDRAGDPASRLAEYVEPLRTRIAFEAVEVLLESGCPAGPEAFDGVDGVVVGGGLTPAYLEGLDAAAPAVARAVARGASYLGFSAGAMVAPGRALIGGYLVDGTEVCGEECGEGLESLEIRDGLALAPFTVDVHAAQAGTLGRAVGAVTAGLVARAVAIDENTALILSAPGAGDFEVIGSGNCWDVRGNADGAAGTAGGSAVVTVLRAAGAAANGG